MTCTQAGEPFLPEGKHSWSENICVAGVFEWAVNEDGDTVPVSADLIRTLKGPSMDSETGELRMCRRHVGHVSIDSRGDLLPWYCGNPVSTRWYVSPMAIAVNENGDAVAVGYHKTPIWTEMVFYSQDRYCGAVDR